MKITIDGKMQRIIFYANFPEAITGEGFTRGNGTIHFANGTMVAIVDVYKAAGITGAASLYDLEFMEDSDNPGDMAGPIFRFDVDV
jgi:hypothetical protein